MCIDKTTLQEVQGQGEKDEKENQDVARAAERIYELHIDEIIKTFNKYQEEINEKAQAIQREIEEAMRAIDRQ